MNSERKTIICGLGSCVMSTISAYMFNKAFKNLQFRRGNDLKSDIESNANYLFVHGAPNKEIVNALNDKNSLAVVVEHRKDELLSACKNVKWILGNNTLGAVFNNLTRYGANLKPVTLEKLNSITEKNFGVVFDFLIEDLILEEQHIIGYLDDIFKVYDKLFTYTRSEIDLLAECIEKQTNNIIEFSQEFLVLTVGNERYPTLVVETSDQNVLEYLDKLFDERYQKLSILLITHKHFATGIQYFSGVYREGINITPFKNDPNIKINEELKTIEIEMVDTNDYFKRDPYM